MHERVQLFRNYDYVVIIGTTKEITKIIPKLKTNVGSISQFIDGKHNMNLDYVLLNVSDISHNMVLYEYEVRDLLKEKKKKLQIVFYVWLQERLPSEFTEILQLLEKVTPKRVICASNRRKEVFSLLHLFYMKVVCIRECISVVDTFSLHENLCNGSPLDRLEMLFVMRTLLEFGKNTDSIAPKSLETAKRWCQLYREISIYLQKYPTMVTVLPKYLPSYTTALNDDVKRAYERNRHSFFERPRSRALSTTILKRAEEKKNVKDAGKEGDKKKNTALLQKPQDPCKK